MKKFGESLVIIGVLLLVIGGVFSATFLGSVVSLQASYGQATIGASAQGITPVQAGSIIAGLILCVAGIYMMLKKQ